jgi:selenide,water dikinase
MGVCRPVDLVLIGGGHTHVEILRRWITDPAPRTRVTLVLDRPRAVYSGMVPGFGAGDYGLRDIEIDAAQLGRRAGAHVVVAPATAIDPVARRIDVDGHPPLGYDVASLDVGSTVRGLDLPGVRQHALATRPIRDYVDRLDATIAAVTARGRGKVRLVTVGGGAAGVELGFTLRARLLAGGVAPEVTVLADSDEILPGDGARAAARVRREALARGITIRTRARAVAVGPEAVVLDGERVPADLVVWATGAAPAPLVASSPLPHDAAGFVRVRPTLQVVGHDDIFAAGDCASVEGAPWVRKAGVYAVREQSTLDANLRARIAGAPLRPYVPQRRILSLIHLGERCALATKWGVVIVGRWVWHAKRLIDERFVRRYRRDW